jgi:hypothetical protein
MSESDSMLTHWLRTVLSVLLQALLRVVIGLISVLDAPVLASEALFEFIIKKPAGPFLRSGNNPCPTRSQHLQLCRYYRVCLALVIL